MTLSLNDLATKFYRQFSMGFVMEFARQKPQAILCAPVLLAFGIGGYFSLLSEPPLWIGAVALLACITLMVLMRNILRFVMLALCIVALGFVVAQVRTHAVLTPILQKDMDFADIEGRVITVEELEKGIRIVLSDLVIEDLQPEQTPRQIRLKLWKGDGIEIGQRIKVLAGLKAPSIPVIPGGFDFRRHLYFKGIGAAGFVYKPPEIIEQPSIGLSRDMLQSLRAKIADRIQASLDAPYAGLAMALMIGQRKVMSEADIEAMRTAGLAHMLAISGLHIGLFSGVVFFVLRFAMALFPSFALRRPIKKYAAVIALLCAVFYMLIAGATIPSQRATITVAIVFGAMLLDRSAISLRVVACAAFTLLLFFPESLTSASFQMSFAAVTGLVAFYDWLRPVWSQVHRQAGIGRRIALYFVGISITTVIATAATAPFTVYHFQQLASYGLLANFICVPILGFVVMPGAVLALFLMPFGLQGLGLSIMQPGLDVMFKVAHFTASLDGSLLRVPQISSLALVFCVVAVLACVILRGYTRIVMCCVFFVFSLLSLQLKQWDILVSSEFDLLAFRPDEAG